jgi:hypothetical protein
LERVETNMDCFSRRQLVEARVWTIPLLITLLFMTASIKGANAQKLSLPTSWKASPPVVYRPIGLDESAYEAFLQPFANPFAQVGQPYTPAEVVGAYGLGAATDLPNTTGAGETVYIVDAYGDTSQQGTSIVDNIQSDLSKFCTNYGLTYSGPGSSSPTLTEQFPVGNPTIVNSNWALETSLDVEWIHSIAPGAKIVLIVTPDNDISLFNGVQYAGQYAPIVSMSWGADEFVGESTFDSVYFGQPNVIYINSSGDSGAGTYYPGSSPNVVTVGGTELTINSSESSGNTAYSWLSETAWPDSSGGVSQDEGPAIFQSALTSGNRELPDVSAIGGSYVSVASGGSWYEVTGTSLSAPIWAGITALVDGNLSSPAGVAGLHNALYYLGESSSSSAYFHDITSGSNGAYNAGPGYDLVTGFGTPIGTSIVPELVTLFSPTSPATSVLVAAVQGSPGQTIMIDATLERSFLTTPLSGQLLSFVVAGTSPVVATTNSSGVASIPYTIPAATTVGSTLSVSISYAGQNGYAGSTGSSSIEVVPSITLSSFYFSPVSVVYTSPSTGYINLTAPAPASGATINILYSGSVFATLTIPSGLTQGEFQISSSTPAIYNFVAQIGGSSLSANAIFAQYATTLNVANASGAPGQTVSLSATLTDVGAGPVSGQTVSFAVNGANVGLATTNSSGIAIYQYTIPTNSSTSGVYPIVASFPGEATDATSSGTGSLTVSGTQTTTTISSSLNPSDYGNAVTLTATVSPSVPNGEAVIFYDGSTAIGSGNTTNGIATITTSSLPIGNLSITASYVGDTVFLPSTSSVLIQTVYAVPTLTSLTITPNVVTGGNSATGTITLSQAPVGSPITITLSSTSTAATVPISVSVPIGAPATTFNVTTTAVTSPTNATITASGDGTSSASLTVTNATIPTPPTGLRTVPSATSITLYWNTSSGATSYNVYRGTVSSEEGAVPIVTNAAASTDGTYDVDWTNTGLPANTTYYYQITAVNAVGESGRSAEVSATTGGSRLLAPAVVAAKAGNATVTVTWSAVPGATSYNILRSANSGSNLVIATGVSGLSYTDNGLTNGVTYTYSVAGVNLASQGYPGSASATPEAPSFKIAALASALSVNEGAGGTSTISLSASYGFSGAATLSASGLPQGVTAAFSPASVSAGTPSTLTFTVLPTASAGTTAITVSATSGSLVSSVNVSLTIVSNPIVTSIAVTPSSTSLTGGANQQFAATAYDQFGNGLSTQPTFTWAATRGLVSSSGLYTAPATAGSDTVTAANSAVLGTANITVTNSPPTVAVPATASPNPVTGTTTNLSVQGADAAGAASLTYTWATTGTPAAPVAFSVNGSNAAQNTVASFTTAGVYNFTVTITDQFGLSTTSSVAVTVAQTPTTIAVAPSSATVNVGGTQTFTGSATDQFGAAISPIPTFLYSVSGGGTITASSGVFTATTPGGPFSVTATVGSAANTASVTVVSVGVVKSIALSASSVNAGQTVTATVTLAASVTTSTVITLISSNANVASIPATLTIPAGMTSGTATITTFAVSTNTAVTVNAATNGTTASVKLTVISLPFVTGLSIAPSTVFAGVSATATVTINEGAPAGGKLVALSSSNTAAASCPANVTVPAGATSTTFSITTSVVASSASATITAVGGGGTQSASITVNPVPFTLKLSTSSINAGQTVTGTITLPQSTSTATIVTLSSSNASVAATQASITVPAGTTTSPFTISTYAVLSNTNVVLMGTTNGYSASAGLTVIAQPFVTGLSISPSSVVGGSTATGTVTISVAAPSGGKLIALSSSSTGVASSASIVTVPAGSTSTTFPITTSTVSTNSSATITAVGGGGTQSAQVTVLP